MKKINILEGLKQNNNDQKQKIYFIKNSMERKYLLRTQNKIH